MPHLGPHTIQGLNVVCMKPATGFCSMEIQLDLVSQRLLEDRPHGTKHEVIAELRCVNVCADGRHPGPALRLLPEPADGGLAAGLILLALLARWRRHR